MKLSAFYLLFNDKEFKIEFGRRYDGNDPLLIEYFNAHSKGIKWVSEEATVTIYETGERIFGWPSPSLDHVVTIYPINHHLYGAPNNAIVYSTDGKVKFRLQIPALISDTAKNRRPYMKSEAPLDKYFEKVDWDLDQNNETQLAITIAFNHDWWEKRILDASTGEFGACIASGMR